MDKMIANGQTLLTGLFTQLSSLQKKESTQAMRQALLAMTPMMQKHKDSWVEKANFNP